MRTFQVATNKASKYCETELNSVKHRVVLLEKVARNAALARSGEQQQERAEPVGLAGMDGIGELAEEIPPPPNTQSLINCAQVTHTHTPRTQTDAHMLAQN